MYALRHGARMAYVERQGLHDPPEDYKAPAGRQHAASLRDGRERRRRRPSRVPGPCRAQSVAVIDRLLDVTIHQL